MTGPEFTELPFGGAIVGFETMAELQAYMAEKEEQAIANTVPEQDRIIWGGYAIRFVPKLVIFAQIETEQSYLEQIFKPGQDPDEELLYELRVSRRSYADGYRYGRWYSTIEPTGEWGSAHQSVCWPITEEDFNYARDHEWQPSQDCLLRVGEEMSNARSRMERKQHE